MFETSIQFLRCPGCQNQADLILLPGFTLLNEEIDQGVLDCTACNTRYSIEHGIAELLPSNIINQAVKDREKEAWKKIAETGGYYEENRQFNLSLPYVTEDNPSDHWQRVKHLFPKVLDMMGDLQGKRVLDLASSTTWATRRFADQGAHAFALDYNDDPFTGLGLGRIYIENGAQFERIRADGEHIPLASDSMDFVFICAALHHFDHPDTVAKEIARILKKGGQVYCQQEYYRPWCISEAREHQKNETVVQFREHGVNERNYTNNQYESFFRKADMIPETMIFDIDGFHNHHIVPFEAWHKNFFQLSPSPVMQHFLALLRKPVIRRFARYYIKNFTILERILIATNP